MKLVKKFLSLLLSGTLLMSSCGMVQAKKIKDTSKTISQTTSQSDKSSEQSTDSKIINDKDAARNAEFDRVLNNYKEFRRLEFRLLIWNVIFQLISNMGTPPVLASIFTLLTFPPQLYYGIQLIINLILL